MHEVIYVVKVGKWPYREFRNFDDAERLKRKLDGTVSHLQISAERRWHK